MRILSLSWRVAGLRFLIPFLLLAGCQGGGTGGGSGANVLALLDAVPGETTLDQFRDRFKVVDVRETKTEGIVTARAGAAANLDLGALQLARLTGVFVDSRLFELQGELQAADSARFVSLMTSRYGKPVFADSVNRWNTTNGMLLHKKEGIGQERFILTNRPLAAAALERGYEGLTR